MSRYFVNAFSQISGRVFSSGVSLLVYILIARFLGTDIFGQYSYILTFLALFVSVADFGTQLVLAKDIAQIKESAETYLGNFLILRIGLSLLAIIVAIITAHILRQDLLFYLLIGCLSLPFLCSHFSYPIYQVYHRPWLSTFSSVIYGSLYLVFSLFAIFFTKSLLPIILVYVGSNVIFAIVEFGLTLKLLKPKFDISRDILKSIFKLAFPIGVGSVLTVINSKADIFMLAYMKSDHEVGIYNAAYKFLDISVIIAATLVAPLVPIFSEKAIHDRKLLQRSYRNVTEVIAILTIPMAIIVPHVSPILIDLLYGPAFSESAHVLNILTWVGILVTFSLVNSSVCISMGLVKQACWSGAVAATLNILLNYFWIPKYSYIGSAWATFICEIFLVAVPMCYALKNVGNIFDCSKWIKIIFVNLLLYFLMNMFFLKLALMLKIITSLTLYFLLVVLFKMISITTIKEFFGGKNVVIREK